MKSLTGHDLICFEAAQGWIELGNHAEASHELSQIHPQSRGHPDVLEVQWKISALNKQWEACLGIAETLADIAPRRATSWLFLAASLHRLRDVEEACETLADVMEDFPDNPALPYQLACYFCELGDLDEALQWLEKACELGDRKELQKLALEDPAFKPLWDSLRKH